MNISFSVEKVISLQIKTDSNFKMGNLFVHKLNKHFYFDFHVSRFPPDEADDPNGTKLTYEPDKSGWFSQYIHRYPYYLGWGGKL